MRTTETAVAALESERDQHLAAGNLVAAKQATQAITAHETIGRLRAELAEHPDRGDPVVAGRYAQQITSWLGYVDADVDPPAPAAAAEPAPGDQSSESTSDDELPAPRTGARRSR